MASFLNLFDSKQMGNKMGRERTALNLNYHKMKITGMEEKKQWTICDQGGADSLLITA